MACYAQEPESNCYDPYVFIGICKASARVFTMRRIIRVPVGLRLLRHDGNVSEACVTGVTALEDVKLRGS